MTTQEALIVFEKLNEQLEEPLFRIEESCFGQGFKEVSLSVVFNDQAEAEEFVEAVHTAIKNLP